MTNTKTIQVSHLGGIEVGYVRITFSAYIPHIRHAELELMLNSQLSIAQNLRSLKTNSYSC